MIMEPLIFQRKVIGGIVSPLLFLSFMMIGMVLLQHHKDPSKILLSSFSTDRQQNNNSNRNNNNNLRISRTLIDHKTVVLKHNINNNNVIIQDDIDPTILACGHWKCFSRSLSNPNLGYQLIRNGDAEDYRMAKYKENFESHRDEVTDIKLYDQIYTFAQCLQTEYNIPHLLGKPQRVEITKDMMERMKMKNLKDLHPSMRKNKALFRPGEITILPVPYKEKAIPFHIVPGQNTTVLERHIRDAILLSTTKDDYYVTNFVTSMQRLNKTISEKVQCLIVDFQAMLDDNGIVYLFDIDPCRNSKTCKGDGNSKIDPYFRKTQLEPFQQIVSKLINFALSIKYQ